MGKESSKVWSGLKKEFDRQRLHYVRIEHKYLAGIPDVNVHFRRMGDAWMELKYQDLPKNHTSAACNLDLGLEREQYIWLKEAQEAGRVCFLVACIGESWYWWDDEPSWLLAKHNSPLRLLLRRAHRATNPEALVSSIQLRIEQRLHGT